MSTYKNLRGNKVKFLTSDLNSPAAEGQIFYSGTDDRFKAIVSSAAWHTGGSLGTGRYALAQGSGGTVDAAIAVFGRATTGATEEYNGTGWQTGGTGNTARYGGAKFGTQTTAVAAGGKNGSIFDSVEEYNGSTWTEVNDYTGTDRGYLAGFGTLTAGAICGGVTAGSPDTWYALTEEYDGTNWTNGGNLNNVRAAHATTGTLTAGITFGGYVPALTAKTEEYNGTAWTETGDLNTARSHLAGSGTQTAALAYGGLTPPATTQTEDYNGSTWTTSSATLAVAVGRHSSAGSAASTGLAFGGNPPGVTTTQEYLISTNVTTGAAWASGGNMNDGRGSGGDVGIYTAGLVFGGNPGDAPYTTANSEEYNGSAWSEGNNLGHAASDVSGAGTQTAAVAFAFSDSPTASTQEYNGTSWSEVNDLPGNQAQGRGIGIQTAALLVGYSSPGTATNEYDGTNWTTGGNHNNKRSGQKPGGWGTQTAAILASGYQTPPAVLITNTELYNGTSWTETGHAVVQGIKRTSATTAGTSTSGMLMGGGTVAGDNTTSGITQAYNGTTWVTSATLSTARINPLGFGTSANAVVCGPPTATEEFTAESTAANVKTLTDS